MPTELLCFALHLLSSWVVSASKQMKRPSALGTIKIAAANGAECVVSLQILGSTSPATAFRPWFYEEDTCQHITAGIFRAPCYTQSGAVQCY